MISPDVIQLEMGSVSRACVRLDQLARLVGAAYTEAYEASLSKNGSGEGSGNRKGLPLGDPTGDIAISGAHKRMRWHVLKAMRALRAEPYQPQSVISLLEEARQHLEEAFLETDPEFREKLVRLRELEEAAITPY
jgi:hypothetical protein